MLCIHLEMDDPFFCLAAEEYLLKNFSEDIFLVWQSDHTVVVGKHQNAMAEINYPFVHRNNITVARRISGGGTVYHDSGNVNFSYIKTVNSPAEISFKRFTRPIVDSLAVLGLQATTSGRNDLLIDGKKISGNAEHVYKNRVLHHGTLLFDSRLDDLGKAIQVTPGKYQGKAVPSVRSRVTNIKPYLHNRWNTDNFSDFLIEVQLRNRENTLFELSENDKLTIRNQATEKFSTWEWNFGYSPRYLFQNEVMIDGKTVQTQLTVEKGSITGASVSGTFFHAKEATLLESILPGKKHIFESLSAILTEIQPNATAELIFSFF